MRIDLQSITEWNKCLTVFTHIAKYISSATEILTRSYSYSAHTHTAHSMWPTYVPGIQTKACAAYILPPFHVVGANAPAIRCRRYRYFASSAPSASELMIILTSTMLPTIHIGVKYGVGALRSAQMLVYHLTDLHWLLSLRISAYGMLSFSHETCGLCKMRVILRRRNDYTTWHFSH
jgi:hypothetical protein